MLVLVYFLHFFSLSFMSFFLPSDSYMSRFLPATGNLNVTLQVWDIGGQTLGGKMLDKYVYGAHVRTHTYTQVHTQSFLAPLFLFC